MPQKKGYSKKEASMNVKKDAAKGSGKKVIKKKGNK